MEIHFMRGSIKDVNTQFNTSSVADIAFLLLSFFLMTTVIGNDMGLAVQLPEWRAVPVTAKVHERNLFSIQINSRDRLMVEGQEVGSIIGMREKIKAFILNNGVDKTSSDSPKDAIVSIKSDRGTTHKAFIQVLDEAQAAYHEIYAARLGMRVSSYLRLNNSNKDHSALIEKAKEGLPMNISLAEPSEIEEP